VAKLLLITIEFSDREPIHEEVAAKIGRAKDWARFSPSGWLVWTDLTASEWYERLVPLLKKNEHILVIEVTRTLKGRVPKKVADWLQRDQRDADLDGD
jgi:hypothetical protein